MSKRITISHLLKARGNWLDTSVAGILLGLGVIGSTVYGQCHPPTPCPCAADGMCYPKRDTWGNYTTNWRPYPGDTIGVPTPAGEQRIEDKLPPFIVPRPDQEDLRGPVRPTRPAAPAEQSAVGQPPELGQPPAVGQPLEQGPPAGGEQPAEGPMEDAPGPLNGLDLPGFGPPQGALQPLPQIEDGPPALPTGLSQAAAMRGDVGYQTQFAQPSTATEPTASANAVSSPKSLPSATVSQSRYVTPAANTIELTNPAAQKVQKTMDQDLQHAIYYEASDRP